MVMTKLTCPHCGSEDIIRHGISESGKQRYRCKNPECDHVSFLESYTNKAWKPSVKNQVYELTVNGNGTRAIARILGIAKNTVTSILKKVESEISYINYDFIEKNRENIARIDLVRVEGIEMDEMWSFVHDKSQQYWLWWAVDHNTGSALAYVLGTRESAYLDQLRDLLCAYFDVDTVFADGYAAYENISESELVVGKENTWRVEGHHTALRTWCSRLVRKGIRFSKTHQMHSIVLGLVINFWFFGQRIWC